MHKTSAWPLALTYTALIVFASLFPFDGWREQGIDPLVFLFARIPPPYWTGFDVVTNLVGYAPLGFLLVLGLLRSGWRHVLWEIRFLLFLIVWYWDLRHFQRTLLKAFETPCDFVSMVHQQCKIRVCQHIKDTRDLLPDWPI